MIKIRRSKIHGAGVYAACDIAKGTAIIQYVGRKITKKQSAKILERTKKLIYLFELDDKYDLDGDVSWNKARYINHSCNPNCESVSQGKEIWIYAMRDIKQGEELSYDYNFPRAGWQDHPCHCGAKNCFGFIVGKKFRAAIAKTKRYQQLKS